MVGKTPRLSRDDISALLARPAVSPGARDTHVVALPADAKVMLAAVLIPLIPRDDDIHVLLTQRTPHLKDHPSQISFPGGRVEGGDQDRIETALREAEEEIGLAREHVMVLGSLPDYDMPSGSRISPVIGWIEPPVTLKLDPIEVDSAFEVPLSYLLNPANHQYRRYEFNGRSRDYLAMPYEGRYIWGATAGMLQRLSQQLAADSS
ncbi:MAG TPA: CoA pyrophosphatase [Burkholderiales bacterium]|nr:CoA pyrophosphatase [Burkholderiales bacterium]